MVIENFVYVLQLLCFFSGITLLIAVLVPDYLAARSLDAEQRLEQRLEYCVLSVAAWIGFAVLLMA